MGDEERRGVLGQCPREVQKPFAGAIDGEHRLELVVLHVQPQVADVATTVLQLGILATLFVQSKLVVHHREDRTKPVLRIRTVELIPVENLETRVVCRHPFQVFRAVPSVVEQKNFHMHVGCQHEALDVVDLVVTQINQVN